MSKGDRDRGGIISAIGRFFVQKRRLASFTFRDMGFHIEVSPNDYTSTADVRAFRVWYARWSERTIYNSYRFNGHGG